MKYRYKGGKTIVESNKALDAALFTPLETEVPKEKPKKKAKKKEV